MLSWIIGVFIYLFVGAIAAIIVASKMHRLYNREDIAMAVSLIVIGWPVALAVFVMTEALELLGQTIFKPLVESGIQLGKNRATKKKEHTSQAHTNNSSNTDDHPTTNAVDILHKRYVSSNPTVTQDVEDERTNTDFFSADSGIEIVKKYPPILVGCMITGKEYWTQLVVDKDGKERMVVTEKKEGE